MDMLSQKLRPIIKFATTPSENNEPMSNAVRLNILVSIVKLSESPLSLLMSFSIEFLNIKNLRKYEKLNFINFVRLVGLRNSQQINKEDL